MPDPKISFIVAVHDCLDLTRAMIRSLEATVALDEHELIIIDDASSDETRQFLESFSDRYTVLRNEENEGFAKSNNKAAQQATGEYLLLLNTDLELTPGWLEPMIETRVSHLKTGAVGNIQRNFATKLVDHAGIFFNLDGMPTHAWKNRKRAPGGNWKERNAVTAACLLISRSLFETIGGFDESYLNGMEDVDLCVRLKQAGYRLFVSHMSVIFHHISSSPGRHKHNDRNSLLFKRRWARTMSGPGKREWPSEYFHRYARYWWRMDPKLALKALFMLIVRR